MKKVLASLIIFSTSCIAMVKVSHEKIIPILSNESTDNDIAQFYRAIGESFDISFLFYFETTEFQYYDDISEKFRENKSVAQSLIPDRIGESYSVWHKNGIKLYSRNAKSLHHKRPYPARGRTTTSSNTT